MKKDAKTVENWNRQPDEIIRDLGGCGWYQVRMTLIVHLMKTVFCFSISNLLISTVTPTWWCVVEESRNNFLPYMVDNVSVVDSVPSYRRNEMSCTPLNVTTCSQVLYDENLSTLVSEVNNFTLFTWITILKLRIMAFSKTKLVLRSVKKLNFSIRQTHLVTISMDVSIKNKFH